MKSLGLLDLESSFLDEGIFLSQVCDKLYMIILSDQIKIGNFTLAFEFEITDGWTINNIYHTIMYGKRIDGMKIPSSYSSKLRMVPKSFLSMQICTLKSGNIVNHYVMSICNILKQFHTVDIPISYDIANSDDAVLNYIRFNNGILNKAIVSDWKFSETNIDNLIMDFNINIDLPNIIINVYPFVNNRLHNKISVQQNKLNSMMKNIQNEIFNTFMCDSIK